MIRNAASKSLYRMGRIWGNNKTTPTVTDANNFSLPLCSSGERVNPLHFHVEDI